MKLLLVFAMGAFLCLGCEEREMLVEPKPVPEREQVKDKIEATEAEVRQEIEATKERTDPQVPDLPPAE